MAVTNAHAAAAAAAAAAARRGAWHALQGEQLDDVALAQQRRQHLRVDACGCQRRGRHRQGGV